MYISELTLDNYRNYEKQNLKFSPNNNFIIGDNGQGKTNLIEAIYILGMAKSFRISTDKDLIKKGEDYFYAKGIFYEENLIQSSNEKKIQHIIELGYNGQKKNVKYDGVTQRRLIDWIGKLKIMVFLNHDVELILGPSSLRRKYMDMVISLSNASYLYNLQQYLKVLKNRNKYLKEENPLFNIYDEQLIEYGSNVIYQRVLLFKNIRESVKEIFSLINPNIKNFTLDYKCNLGTIDASINYDSIKELYGKLVKQNINKDLLYKATVTGPHRDDFYIRNGKEMFKKFASQGQNRAGALTLKMIAIKHIENKSKQKVILLLDDILLDLDTNKKDSFLKLVKTHQCFFTSTSISGIGNIDRNRGKTFEVKSGNTIEA